VDVGKNIQEKGERMEDQNQNVQQPVSEGYEQPEKASMGKVILAALAASVIGAIVWAAITYYANYELGLIAWGIGALVGAAVAYIAKNRVEQSHQVIAVIFGLAGVLAGKYLSYYLIVKKVEDETGISLDGVSTFSDMFEAIDILWIVLAGYIAWTMPKRMVNRT
jgi:fucose permease